MWLFDFAIEVKIPKNQCVIMAWYQSSHQGNDCCGTTVKWVYSILVYVVYVL